MTASNPSTCFRILLRLLPALTLVLALTALPPKAGTAAKKIKISKPYVVSSILHRRSIPLANYHPRPLRVFGNRSRATVCPDPSIIRRYIRKARRELSSCYRRLVLSRHPKRQGRVEVGFTINPRGRVTAVRVRRSALRDRPTERCLAQVLGKLRFPAINAIIHVIYPFYFRPR